MCITLLLLLLREYPKILRTKQERVFFARFCRISLSDLRKWKRVFPPIFVGSYFNAGWTHIYPIFILCAMWLTITFPCAMLLQLLMSCK